jgi:hypothetical protein
MGQRGKLDFTKQKCRYRKQHTQGVSRRGSTFDRVSENGMVIEHAVAERT